VRPSRHQYRGDDDRHQQQDDDDDDSVASSLCVVPPDLKKMPALRLSEATPPSRKEVETLDEFRPHVILVGAAYREALKEQTRERVPLDWAETQKNLESTITLLDQRKADGRIG
jgi:hypothetical protein